MVVDCSILGVEEYIVWFNLKASFLKSSFSSTQKDYVNHYIRKQSIIVLSSCDAYNYNNSQHGNVFIKF